MIRMMNVKAKLKKQSKEAGQAIIEFLVVIVIILTLIFVFVQISWSIAYGHYIHYITYMASRAYYSGGVTQQDQIEAATSVLSSGLKTDTGADLLGFIAKARGGGDRDISGLEPVTGAFLGKHPEAEGKENSRPYSWAEGTQYSFGVKIFLLPMASWITKEGEGTMIQPGAADDPSRAVEWKGYIPYASDSFLGREVTTDECLQQLNRLSFDSGINRGDGNAFLEDNGC